MRTDLEPNNRRSAGLVDLLDRILDKGLVVAGDIKISLAEVELLTIRIRLLVCSVDKAEQIGLDWWKHDKHLSGTGRGLIDENQALREQVRRLEDRVAALADNGGPRRLKSSNGRAKARSNGAASGRGRRGGGVR